MSDSRVEAQRGRSVGKQKARQKAKNPTYSRYPQWKIDLFRIGISERQQSHSGQVSGRALRAPGA
jgi:hypothetical protein